MDVLERHNIVIIDFQRYYNFDVTTKLPILEHTVPYLFKYQDIEIYETSWVRLSVRLIEELDKRFPHDDNFYLSIRYPFSNTDVFSSVKRTNYAKFKDIYLNTNHTATHALMSLQCILLAMGIKLEDCTLIIKRHPLCEPKEVREYYINKIRNEFADFLKFEGMDDERVAKVIKNMETVNKILANLEYGYDNFYLFDDYNTFLNYKTKVIEKAKEIYFNDRSVELVQKYLGYYDKYFKSKKAAQQRKKKLMAPND